MLYKGIMLMLVLFICIRVMVVEMSSIEMLVVIFGCSIVSFLVVLAYKED